MSNRGFTLVELLLTLVLLGILAVSAIGLFSTRDSYTARAAADLLLSQARLAQQTALAQAADASIGIALSVTRVTDNLTVSVTAAGFNSQRDTNARGVVVSHKTSGTTACGGGSDSNFTLQFDGSGNLTSGVHNLICITGQQTIPLCITPQGYAYEAVCES